MQVWPLTVVLGLSKLALGMAVGSIATVRPFSVEPALRVRVAPDAKVTIPGLATAIV